MNKWIPIMAILTISLGAMASPVWAKTATAQITGTTEGSQVSGKVLFEETSGGLKISADVSGVTPGKHGFHIHANGSCADGGKAAGGHFNPDNSPHGLLTQDGFTKAHAGDLGNIEIATDGTGKLEEIIPGLGLSQGKHNVAGRAVIVHEKEDDFGQPVGNAGTRIGCGPIQITRE